MAVTLTLLAAGCQLQAPKPAEQDVLDATAGADDAAGVGADATETETRGEPTPSGPGWDVAQVVVGMAHSCALERGGAVYCWGQGHQGQLGRGDREARKRPTRVAAVDDAVAIDAGMTHTCALLRSGQVACWGANHTAKLGDGTTEERLAPVRVVDLDDAVQIGAGMDTTCALKRSGQVVCWGRDLTRRDSGVGDDNKHLPTAVPGLDHVRDMDVGNLHLCAIRGEKRELVCVGLDHAINRPDGYHAKLKVESTGYTGVSRVVAGGGFTCFEKQGAWRCWGSGYKGQLGRPESDTVYADEAAPVPDLDEPRDIVAGDAGACAVDPAGRASCWGYGQPRPYEVAGLGPVRQLALSLSSFERHMCAILSTGALQCWGHNGDGRLGNDSETYSELPVDVLPPLSRSPVVVEPEATATGTPFVAQQIAAGYDETCAISGDGHVWCWGTQHNRVYNDPQRYRTRPVRMQGLEDMVELAGGHGFMCGRTSSGAVWCWGENDQMQLGDGTDDKRLRPVKVPGVSDAVRVAADYGRACALRKSGQIVCWGNHAPPHPLTQATAFAGRIADLTVGAGHLCVTLRSGSVMCMGSNDSGQLGAGPSGCKPDPNDLPCGPRSRCKQREVCEKSETLVAVEGVTDARSVALGGAFTCVLHEAGTVSCWGRNHVGQLGLGADAASRVPKPTAVAGLRKVVQLVADGSHACARLSDGRARCWGQNVFADLGDRTTEDRPSPSPVYGIDDAVTIATGSNHGCAIRESGQVWCWGKNDDGVLAVGDELRRHPVAKPVLR